MVSSELNKFNYDNTEVKQQFGGKIVRKVTIKKEKAIKVLVNIIEKTYWNYS